MERYIEEPRVHHHMAQLQNSKQSCYPPDSILDWQKTNSKTDPNTQTLVTFFTARQPPRETPEQIGIGVTGEYPVTRGTELGSDE